MASFIHVYGLIFLMTLLINSRAEINAQHLSTPEFAFADKSETEVTIPFKLVHNLILIEMSINDSGPLTFILDSGVGKTLITGLPNQEEFFVSDAQTVMLAGLGENEALQALLTKNNNINLKGINGHNVDVIILKEDIFDLSSYMGTYVHGLIGFDLLSQFVVEINYRNKVIHFYDPIKSKRKFKNLSKHRRWHKIPIQLHRLKPYLNLQYKHSAHDNPQQVELLIDTGASFALSLYEVTNDYIRSPQNILPAFLGVGLSGDINGYLGRVEEVNLGKLNFHQPVVAFPDSLSIRKSIQISESNGSIGGEIWRRFKLIFNYPEEYILLRGNRDFADDFSYNMSGIELMTPFPQLPVYIVSGIRNGSPADRAGVETNDIIEAINGVKTGSLDLSEVILYMEGKKGNHINLQVKRDTTQHRIRFILKNEIPVD